jgi:chloride channel protein, CIC family
VWITKLVHPREAQGILLWAGVIGFIGGMVAVLFRLAIWVLQSILTQHPGSLVNAAMELPWWQRLTVPLAGGLLAGLVIHIGGRFTRGQHSTDYMEAIVLGSGTIRMKPSLVKSASSLFTIASGGSIGREGAMVQLSAMLASWFGRHAKNSTPRLRLMVACGTAAGLASVYNAPIAGSLFVAEIIFGTIAMESFGPLLVAAVSATLTARYFGLDETYFQSPHVRLVSGWEMGPYLVLGVVLGLCAPSFVRLLRRAEDLFAAVAPSVYLRLTLGGLVVGLISVFCPAVWGNGQSMVDLVLQGHLLWQALVILLVCKLAATAATVGSGAVGGVFTPTLLIGCILGCLMGRGVELLSPAGTGGAQAYALVGMGGFLAAVTQAPLTSILMVFEMTLDYDIVLPLMLVCVTAYFTARSMDGESIYAHALRKKTAELPQAPQFLCVRDLMKPAPASVLETAGFDEIARIFAGQPYNNLHVVNPAQRLCGTISLHDIKSHLQSPELAGLVIAVDVMHPTNLAATPETPLLDVLENFRQYAGERLPVVNNHDERRLIGCISKTDVLLALAHGSGVASQT